MTDTLPRTTDEERAEPKRREPFLGLSPLQVLGGALAATSAAVVSSYLGVAGTLIGAALASIVSTVGGAFYTQSMKTAGGHLRSRLVRRQRPAGTGSVGVTDAAQPGPPSPSVSAHRTGSSAADALVVDTRTGFGVRLRRALGSIDRRMWFGTAAVFLLAIVAITGFEVATGKPVSATVSGSSSSGTSIGSVVDPGSSSSGTSTDSPTQGSTGQATPTSEATAPSGENTQDSGNQQQSVPQQDATTDSGSDSGSGSGSGATADSGSGAGTDSGADSGSDAGSGADSGSNGSGANSGSDAGSGAAAGGSAADAG